MAQAETDVKDEKVVTTDTTSTEASTEQSQLVEDQLDDGWDDEEEVMTAKDLAEEENDENESDAAQTTKQTEPTETSTNSQESERANERIRGLIEQNKNIAQELEAYKAQVSQYQEMGLPSLEDVARHLMSRDEDLSEEEAMTEARIRLIEAERKRDADINNIALTRQEIDNAVTTARLEYPEIFDSENPNFDKNLAVGIMEIYEKVADVKRGSDGEIISTRIKMRPFLNTMAEMVRHAEARGLDRAKAELSAKTTPVKPSPTPYPNQGMRRSKDDALFDGWDDDDD